MRHNYEKSARLYLQEFWFMRSSTRCTSAVSCRFPGEEYFGPRAEDFDSGDMRAAPFSDRTGWFLTSYRIVIGGTASINAFFSLMVFEAYRGKIKVAAAVAAILSVFSVLATSSRSDIAGLAVAAIVFALCSPVRRWKLYVCAAIAVAGLYATYLTVCLSPGGAEPRRWIESASFGIRNCARKAPMPIGPPTGRAY